MMNILIPMAGQGKRFSEMGYKESKPAISTFDRKTGTLKPMVVCATLDLPGVEKNGSNVIYVDRDYHKENGTEACIKEHFPEANFITLDYLTDGQACTCLVAEEFINNENELLIAGCDNGMEYDCAQFDQMKKDADVIVFTYRNNEAVLRNPDAYGWMIVGDDDNVLDVSIKKAVSDNPMNDHAVVATFWFREGRLFVEAANEMIRQNDRINGEFYVDEVIKYNLKWGQSVKVFDVDRYICWGTPEDYELYQNTFSYWYGFWKKEGQK